MDDFEFVDVEGEAEGDIGRMQHKKKDVLEEGKSFFFLLFVQRKIVEQNSSFFF